jgi:hypothetical protein
MRHVVKRRPKSAKKAGLLKRVLQRNKWLVNGLMFWNNPGHHAPEPERHISYAPSQLAG